MSNFGRFRNRKASADYRPDEHGGDRSPRYSTGSMKGSSFLGYLNPMNAFSSASAALSATSSTGSVKPSPASGNRTITNITLQSSSSRHLITDLVTVKGHGNASGLFQWYRITPSSQAFPLLVTTTPYYSPTIDDVHCHITCQFIGDSPSTHSQPIRAKPIGPFRLSNEQKAAITTALSQPIQQVSPVTMISSHFYTDPQMVLIGQDDSETTIDDFLDDDDSDSEHATLSPKKTKQHQSSLSKSSSSSLSGLLDVSVPNNSISPVNSDRPASTLTNRMAYNQDKIPPFLFIPTIAASTVTRAWCQAQRRNWASMTILSPEKDVVESTIMHGTRCQIKVLENTVCFFPSPRKNEPSTRMVLTDIHDCILTIPIAHVNLYISLQEFTYPVVIPPPTPGINGSSSISMSNTMAAQSTKECSIPPSLLAHLIDTRDNTLYTFQFKSEYERDMFILTLRERIAKQTAPTKAVTLDSPISHDSTSLPPLGLAKALSTSSSSVPLQSLPPTTAAQDVNSLLLQHPTLVQSNVYHNTYHPLQAVGGQSLDNGQPHLAIPSFDRFSSEYSSSALSLSAQNASISPSPLSLESPLPMSQELQQQPGTAKPLDACMGHLAMTMGIATFPTISTGDDEPIQHAVPGIDHQTMISLPMQPALDIQATIRSILEKHQVTSPTMDLNANGVHGIPQHTVQQDSPQFSALISDLQSLYTMHAAGHFVGSNTINALRQEKQAMHMDNQTLKAQYDLLQTQHRNMLQSDTRNNAKCQEQELELARQQEYIVTLQQKLSQLEAHVGPAHRDLGKIKQENITLKANLEQLTTNNKTLLEEKREINDDYRRILVQHQDRLSDNIALQKYIHLLQNDLTMLYQQLEAKDNESQQLRHALTLPPQMQQHATKDIASTLPIETTIAALSSRSPEGQTIIQSLPCATAAANSPAMAAPALSYSHSSASSTSSTASPTPRSSTKALLSVTNKVASGFNYLTSSTTKSSQTGKTSSGAMPSIAGVPTSASQGMTPTTPTTANTKKGDVGTRQQIIQLHYQLQQSEVAIVRLNAELSQLNADNKLLAMQLQDNAELNNDLTMALDNTRKKLTIADQTHGLAIDQLKATYEEKLLKQDEEVTLLRSSRAKVQTLQADLSSVHTQLSLLEHTVAQYHQHFADYTSRIAVLEADLVQSKQRCAAYEQLQEEHQALQEQFTMLQHAWNTLDNKYTALCDTNAVLEHQVDELESKLQIYSERIELDVHNKVVTESQYYKQKCYSLSLSLEHILQQRQQQQHLVERQQHQLDSLRLEIDQLQHTMHMMHQAQQTKGSRWSITSPISLTGWRKRGKNDLPQTTKVTSPSLSMAESPTDVHNEDVSSGHPSRGVVAPPSSLLMPAAAPTSNHFLTGTGSEAYTLTQSKYVDTYSGAGTDSLVDPHNDAGDDAQPLSYDQLQLEWALLKQQVKYQQEDLIRLQSYAQRLLEHYSQQGGSANSSTPLAWTLRLLSNMNPIAYLPSWRGYRRSSDVHDDSLDGSEHHIDETSPRGEPLGPTNDASNELYQRRTSIESISSSATLSEDRVHGSTSAKSTPKSFLPLSSSKQVAKLQHIISMLTLAITEKEEIIQEFRQVNSLLGDKIQRLEGTLKLHHIPYVSPRANAMQQTLAITPTIDCRSSIAPGPSSPSESPVITLTLPSQPIQPLGLDRTKPQQPTPHLSTNGSG